MALSGEGQHPAPAGQYDDVRRTRHLFTREFGVRLEDDMYITPEGAMWFTLPSNSLEDPFAK